MSLPVNTVIDNYIRLTFGNKPQRIEPEDVLQVLWSVGSTYLDTGDLVRAGAEYLATLRPDLTTEIEEALAEIKRTATQEFGGGAALAQAR